MGHTGEHERGGRAGERVAASGGKQRVQMTIAHSPTTSTSLSTRVARVEQHGGGGGGGGGDEGGGASRAADGSYRPRPQPQRHAQAGGCWAGASGYASGSRFGTSVFAIGTLTTCLWSGGSGRRGPVVRQRQAAGGPVPLAG
jgi:hypothetical protein